MGQSKSLAHLPPNRKKMFFFVRFEEKNYQLTFLTTNLFLFFFFIVQIKDFDGSFYPKKKKTAKNF